MMANIRRRQKRFQLGTIGTVTHGLRDEWGFVRELSRSFKGTYVHYVQVEDALRTAKSCEVQCVMQGLPVRLVFDREKRAYREALSLPVEGRATVASHTVTPAREVDLPNGDQAIEVQVVLNYPHGPSVNSGEFVVNVVA